VDRQDTACGLRDLQHAAERLALSPEMFTMLWTAIQSDFADEPRLIHACGEQL
jgi:hypothetical protein